MEIKIQNLVPVEWSDQRVLTSAQIAEVFSDKEPGGKIVTPRHIKQNFANNRDHFVEGFRYFKIEGDKLQNLRVENFYLQISSKTRALYLWTEAGVFQHAKMLNTKTAWKLYGDLVAFYFRYRDVVIVQPVQTVKKSADRSAAQLAPACVYVTLLHNDTVGEFVKIGHSGKPRNRITTVKRQTKSTTNGIYLTSFMPRKATRLLEWLIQENFSSRRIKGEFFSADFEKVCAALNFFAKVVVTMPLEEKFAKLEVQAKLLADTDEAWVEIDRQYNLFLSENIFCKTIE